MEHADAVVLPCFAFVGKRADCAGWVSARSVRAAPPEALGKCKRCRQSLPARVYQQVIPVTLTDAELDRCRECGRTRHDEAVRQGRPDCHGLESNKLEAHLLGAYGELGAAKALGVEWTASVNTFKAPDVGCIQVRTRSRLGYELLVRPPEKDDPKYPYLLVTVQLPRVYVMGWLWGYEAQRPVWLQTHGDRPPAHFVPHDALHDPLTCPLELTTA